VCIDESGFYEATAIGRADSLEARRTLVPALMSDVWQEDQTESGGATPWRKHGATAIAYQIGGGGVLVLNRAPVLRRAFPSHP
jgi:hypothetical protein